MQIGVQTYRLLRSQIYRLLLLTRSVRFRSSSSRPPTLLLSAAAKLAFAGFTAVAAAATVTVRSIAATAAVVIAGPVAVEMHRCPRSR